MNENNSTLVFVVRHGETEWNQAGKQQGHMDSPLTENGRRQAHALANDMLGRGIAFIFSSDLGRATATAQIIGDRLGLSVQTDPRLRERHLGSLQGWSNTEWRKQYPEEWAEYQSGNPDYCLPGGESARQRYERSVECIEELAICHRGKTILVVSHGGVLRGLFYRAAQVSLAERCRFSMFNAAINRFTIDDSHWQLDTWGEIRHLAELQTLDDDV